ncbi:MAG TPA: DUF58 domain-containing protein [Holophagaceae bacterium]|nr:DUF58 domain-containing protein [Holophagaceae bacterium]
MPLPSRFLARLRRLPLRLRSKLSGGTEGLHPSKIKGSGLTFVENRHYNYGDDPRFINWPLTARLGEPVVKRFEASRELILWLVIDPSPSMYLGDPVSPLRWALELCGAAFATVQATGDRLGLLVPGDGKTPPLRIAPRRGRAHGLRILEMLAERGPSIPTEDGWREALGHWGEHGRGHRLWLLSNGAGLRGLAPLLKPVAARHRVVWFQPELPPSKRAMHWPDPGFAPTVERVSWPLLEDPVARLGAWLKAGGA